MLELSFPILGEAIPQDHGYLLYAAVSTAIPALHHGELQFQLSSIIGDRLAPRVLRLSPRSQLRLRVSAEHLPQLLPLSGKPLKLGEHTIRVGVPNVRALEPAASLAARVVTIKGFTQPEPFLTAVRRQLDALEIRGDPAIPLSRSGRQEGQPARRILRIRDKRVVGFALQISGLTAEESLRLQEHSLGGRQHMGAGYFVPLPEDRR